MGMMQAFPQHQAEHSERAAGFAGLAPPAQEARSFTINGRFLSQVTTGVQRYAKGIVLALDTRLTGVPGRRTLLLPPNAATAPDLGAIGLRIAAGARGHLWEQAILPLRADETILNLCNTGPILAKRQIVCMHDANIFTERDSYSAGFRAFYRFLLPQLAKRGARITSVSHFSTRRLATYLSIDPGDIEVVYNGHEHVFDWNASASRFHGQIEHIRPFVLLLGSQARHKNVNFILKQASSLDALGLDLVVVGGSAPIFTAVDLIRAENIHWLGFVSDDDLACLYRHALCIAFPSRSEGFGLPIVEAMALGCPVVASDQSCLPEICGGAALQGGPDDPRAWTVHFTNLARSAALRAELREKGLERVKAFSWAASAQQYLDLVVSLQ